MGRGCPVIPDIETEEASKGAVYDFKEGDTPMTLTVSEIAPTAKRIPATSFRREPRNAVR
jgi:hypothetical protein